MAEDTRHRMQNGSGAQLRLAFDASNYVDLTVNSDASALDLADNAGADVNITGVGDLTMSGALSGVSSLALSGSLTVGTTLGVTGATTLSSTLDVAGTAEFDANVGLGAAPVTAAGRALAISGTSAGLTLISTTGSSRFEFLANTSGGLGTFDSNASAYRWFVDSAGRIAMGGSTSPNSGALLDLGSTTGGLLVPRMTTAQRDALSANPNGLIIYNTTTNTMQGRVNGAWANL